MQDGRRRGLRLGVDTSILGANRSKSNGLNTTMWSLPATCNDVLTSRIIFMRKVHFSIGLMTKDSALSYEIRGAAVMTEDDVDTAIAAALTEINQYEEDDSYE